MKHYVAVSPPSVRASEFYVNRHPNRFNDRHEVHWGDSGCVPTEAHRAYFTAKPERSPMSSRALQRARRLCLGHASPADCRISFCRNCIQFFRR